MSCATEVCTVLIMTPGSMRAHMHFELLHFVAVSGRSAQSISERSYDYALASDRPHKCSAAGDSKATQSGVLECTRVFIPFVCECVYLLVLCTTILITFAHRVQPKLCTPIPKVAVHST